jgi:hypothetical protein
MNGRPEEPEIKVLSEGLSCKGIGMVVICPLAEVHTPDRGPVQFPDRYD